jgi:hypothetical protein
VGLVLLGMAAAVLVGVAARLALALVLRMGLVLGLLVPGRLVLGLLMLGRLVLAMLGGRVVALLRDRLLVLPGAAVGRAGNERRQVVLDVVAGRVAAARPVVLVAAAVLTGAVGRHAAAAVAAAPGAAMRAGLRVGKALAGLVAAVRVARLAFAHPPFAGVIVAVARHGPTRWISFVSHRLSLSFCAFAAHQDGDGEK